MSDQSDLLPIGPHDHPDPQTMVWSDSELRAIRAYAARCVAAERERWQRIGGNAQAVTTGSEDRIDYFEVPSHLMAALALALDEVPTTKSLGWGVPGDAE